MLTSVYNTDNHGLRSTAHTTTFHFLFFTLPHAAPRPSPRHGSASVVVLLPDLRSLWAPLLYRSPGSVSAWHQSPLPPKKVTHAWVSLPLHLLPAEVWGNFLQVVHGEGEEARWLHCSLWYCQGRVMALCSNSHCGLTECDFGPVFLCITTTLSKKGMAKGLRERKGKPGGQEKTNSDISSEHVCEVPPPTTNKHRAWDNAAQDGGTKTLLLKPESGRLMSAQGRGTLARGITGRSAANALAQLLEVASLCQTSPIQ